MENKRLKKLVILISVFLGLVLLVSLLIFNNEENNIDPRSNANEPEVLYTFAVFTDSHSKDQEMYSKFFELLEATKPDILFHTGDVGWDQHRSSKIPYGDYRYQPLKGLIEMQQNIDNLEIHIATGNHDVVKVYDENDLRSMRLVDGIMKPACEGRHYYWGDYPEDAYIHHELSDLSLNPEIKEGFTVFNKYILEEPFCKPPYVQQSYSFVEGNVKFVVLGWDLFRDDIKLDADVNWVQDNVCGTTDVDSTIVMSHDYFNGTRIDKFLLTVAECENNVDLIFQGHSHQFSKSEDRGFNIMTLGGVMRDRISEDEERRGWNPHGEHTSDFVLGEVYENKIDFTRYVWYKVDASDLRIYKVYTIEGNFLPREESSPIVQEVSWIYNLNKGENIISLPSENNVNKVSDLVEYADKNDISINKVTSFRNSQFKVYEKKDQEFVGEDFSLDYNYSYFVNVVEGGELVLEGNEVEQDISFLKDLSSGWYLISFVGYNGYDSKEFIQEFRGKGIKIESLYYLDSSGYKGVVFNDGVFYGNSFKINENEGYWVKIY